jgi:asparagine N-glycosylation enzyme membrane subunit Stt3
VPGREDLYAIEIFYDALYYHTMAVRLQMLDGSMAEPSEVLYAEIDTNSIPKTGYARVIKSQALPYAEARAKADASGTSGPVRAALLSDASDAPLDAVPALRHYRLIYESSPDAATGVKIFEYVRGAVIPGEGTIEVPIVTNTGREFVYRQQSVDGSFIVPYSTVGNPYGVTAAGNYRIAGSGTAFSVTEEAVVTGGVVGA